MTLTETQVAFKEKMKRVAVSLLRANPAVADVTFRVDPTLSMGIFLVSYPKHHVTKASALLMKHLEEWPESQIGAALIEQQGGEWSPRK